MDLGSINKDVICLVFSEVSLSERVNKPAAFKHSNSTYLLILIGLKFPYPQTGHDVIPLHMDLQF